MGTSFRLIRCRWAWALGINAIYVWLFAALRGRRYPHQTRLYRWMLRNKCDLAAATISGPMSREELAKAILSAHGSRRPMETAFKPKPRIGAARDGDE